MEAVLWSFLCKGKVECLCQIFEVQFATHAVSETISPVTPLKPNFDAAMAAAAMVFTLFGAMGQSSATEPWYKTRLPSPSVQSESRPPVSRKQEGCLDIRMERAYKTFEMYFHVAGTMQHMFLWTVRFNFQQCFNYLYLVIIIRK